MIAGHFGFAAAVKSRERDVPIWALMLATQWLDVLFVPLVAAGVEGLTPLAGSKGGYGEVIIHADYTHSLVGAVVLAILFGAAFARRSGLRAAIVLAAVAFSHWLLDLLMHRADMPLLPGNAAALPRLGLGLWRHPAASAALELALVLVGTILYWRAALATARSTATPTAKAHRAGAVALTSGLLVLALNVAGY
jgi:hypothetical protein